MLGVAFPFGRQPGASGDGLGSRVVGLCCGPAQRPENEAPGNQQADIGHGVGERGGQQVRLAGGKAGRHRHQVDPGERHRHGGRCASTEGQQGDHDRAVGERAGPVHPGAASRPRGQGNHGHQGHHAEGDIHAGQHRAPHRPTPPEQRQDHDRLDQGQKEQPPVEHRVMVGGIASSKSQAAVDQVGRPNRQDHDEQRSLTALPGVGRRRGSSASGRWLLNVHHEEMTKRFHSTRVQIAPCGPLARDWPHPGRGPSRAHSRRSRATSPTSSSGTMFISRLHPQVPPSKWGSNRTASLSSWRRPRRYRPGSPCTICWAACSIL